MKRFVITLAFLPLLPALTGCRNLSTFGSATGTDYGYAVSSPAEAQAVVQRFESAVRCLRQAGFTSSPANEPTDSSHLQLHGNGVHVDLTLDTPEPAELGFACISLQYRYETRDKRARHQANRLLARLNELLAPAAGW